MRLHLKVSRLLLARLPAVGPDVEPAVNFQSHQEGTSAPDCYCKLNRSMQPLRLLPLALLHLHKYLRVSLRFCICLRDMGCLPSPHETAFEAGQCGR